MPSFSLQNFETKRHRCHRTNSRYFIQTTPGSRTFLFLSESCIRRKLYQDFMTNIIEEIPLIKSIQFQNKCSTFFILLFVILPVFDDRPRCYRGNFNILTSPRYFLSFFLFRRPHTSLTAFCKHGLNDVIFHGIACLLTLITKPQFARALPSGDGDWSDFISTKSLTNFLINFHV